MIKSTDKYIIVRFCKRTLFSSSYWDGRYSTYEDFLVVLEELSKLFTNLSAKIVDDCINGSYKGRTFGNWKEESK